MRVAVDFDGTCVYHRYPEVGESLPGAVETLKELISYGHELVLYTMRSDEPHDVLTDGPYQWKADFFSDALGWFKDNDIPVTAHTQWHKPQVDIFIDDLSIGAPLLKDEKGKDYIDWEKAREEFRNRGFLGENIIINFKATFLSSYQLTQLDDSVEVPYYYNEEQRKSAATIVAIKELQNRLTASQEVSDFDEPAITFHK